jgi:modulator of FtsH protease
MSTDFISSAQAASSTLIVNTVLRNTYMLLSLTLLFSAATAAISMALALPPMPLLTIIGYIGLLFLTIKLRDQPSGLIAVFAFTGFMGFTLGPILNIYIAQYVNGPQMIMTALGGTGLVFLGLSAYALNCKTDFSYLSGFLFSFSMILLLGVILSFFFQIPMLQIFLSAGFSLLSVGYLLYETSQVINGGQRNYIMATISLYVSLYNLFLSLLQLLAMFSGRRD